MIPCPNDVIKLPTSVTNNPIGCAALQNTATAAIMIRIVRDLIYPPNSFSHTPLYTMTNDHGINHRDHRGEVRAMIFLLFSAAH